MTTERRSSRNTKRIGIARAKDKPLFPGFPFELAIIHGLAKPSKAKPRCFIVSIC
jgi:hypothetical protein|tara:strand:- start:156 stop:320 length:165 start_codon:yes stop_codon:yes gene_type:complete